MIVGQKGYKRIWVSWAVIAMLLACARSGSAQTDSNAPATREYRVKAAFLYNFISFVDGWRFEQEGQDEDKLIRIGVIGRDPFKDAFDPLKDKRVHGRKIEIKYFKGFSDLNNGPDEVERHPDHKNLVVCDLLFICQSERLYIDKILDPIRTEPMLTIADTDGFLEAGGIINFITEESNVRFEINTAAAKRAKLTIRSKLLRLAKRIIDKDRIGQE